VTIPFVVVVGFDKDKKVAFERIYWDQASVLTQIGPIDKGWPPGHWRGAGGAFARFEPPIEHAHPQGLIPHQALGLRCRGARSPAGFASVAGCFAST
jgi:hypothetical protein